MVRFAFAVLFIAFTSGPAAALCLDPDETTFVGRRMLEMGEPCTKQGKPAALRQLTPAEKLAVARAVQDQLKDPESARFKWSSMMGRNGQYCGEVNAKNSYGGYTGFRPFVATLTNGKVSGVTIFGEDGQLSGTAVAVALCMQNRGES